MINIRQALINGLCCGVIGVTLSSLGCKIDNPLYWIIFIMIIFIIGNSMIG